MSEPTVPTETPAETLRRAAADMRFEADRREHALINSATMRALAVLMETAANTARVESDLGFGDRHSPVTITACAAALTYLGEPSP